MHARLMKETRELLPIFIGTLLLIVVPYLIWQGNAGELAYFVLAGGSAMLGVCAFGSEFQHRTLALLLSQPVARSMLWRDKMLVLGAGISASLAVSAICMLVYVPRLNPGGPIVLAMIALCALCGTPYWILILRQSIGAMVCAVTIPAVLVGANELMKQWLFDHLAVEKIPSFVLLLLQISPYVLLLLYCAVTFRRGYAQFESLEDYDSTAGELSLPASLETALAQPLASVSSRFHGPFASLLKKEFRLQQVSFLLAGVFFLIAAAGFCLIPIYLPAAEGTVGGDCALYILILPLVAGAIAVAEEKGWDLAEWHLTLPPSARQQWSAKMLATLTTSLALGLLLPAGILLAGGAVFEQHGSRPSFPLFYALAALVLGQLLVTSVAVYAASFSKSTLRAILAALGILVASLGGAVLAPRWGERSPLLLGLAAVLFRGHFVLPVLLLSPLLLLCLTQWFAWSNFRRFGAPARRLVIQFVVIFVAVELISLAVSYAALLPSH